MTIVNVALCPHSVCFKHTDFPSKEGRSRLLNHKPIYIKMHIIHIWRCTMLLALAVNLGIFSWSWKVESSKQAKSALNAP